MNIKQCTCLLFTGISAVLFSAFVSAQLAAPYQIDEEWIHHPDGEGWDGATTWVSPDNEGNVLVMVRQAPYFRLFSKEGEFIKAWGHEDEYKNAHSVTYDAEGNVWATDAASHVVYKYNSKGDVVFTLGEKGQSGDNESRTLFNQVNHVGLGPDGDIYVSDGYGNARVVHFSPQGEFIRIIGGSKGEAPGQLSTPHGVAVDSQGRILVNDSDNQRISVFDSKGVFLETWPFPSRGGIVVAGDDMVYVSDVNAGAVNIVKDGELVETIAVNARAHGLGVDKDGTIYVSDARGRKVIRIRPR